jgi:bifunctional non-homologous end joining protein LigD
MHDLPKIEPMKLSVIPEPFDHPDWLFELKHDGFRALAYIAEGQCDLISRRRNAYKSFSQLRTDIAVSLDVTNAVLDGEIVCLDSDGHSVFKELLHRRGEPRYYAFDLLWLDGCDLRQHPLLSRKRMLERLIRSAKCPRLLYAQHIKAWGIEMFHAVCAKNIEGIVAKRKSGIYAPGERWLKIKNLNYTQAEGRRELFDSMRPGPKKAKSRTARDEKIGA